MAILKLTRNTPAPKAPGKSSKAQAELDDVAKRRAARQSASASAPSDETLDPYAGVGAAPNDERMAKAREVAATRAMAQMERAQANREAKAPKGPVGPAVKPRPEGMPTSIPSVATTDPRRAALAMLQAPGSKAPKSPNPKAPTSGMRQATAVQADAQADAPAAQAPKAKAGPANEDELLQKIYDSIGDATQQAELTKQKALVDARARSALSGAGFAGAQSAQEADIAGQMDAQARQQLLNQAGQLLDLQRSDKAFKLKEQEIESVLDQDLNGDGVIGGKAVGKDGVGDRNTENDDKEAIKDEINALLDGMATSSGGVYQPTKAEKRQLEEAGVSFRETERRAPGGAHIYEDDDGNLYVFADGKNTETLDEFFKRVFG